MSCKYCPNIVLVSERGINLINTRDCVFLSVWKDWWMKTYIIRELIVAVIQSVDSWREYQTSSYELLLIFQSTSI
jgi:hypothetical protein